MQDIRCPKLDGFANQLIDAYRQRESFRDSVDTGQLKMIDLEIAHIHEMMTDHRHSCPFCRLRAKAALERKPVLFSEKASHPQARAS